MVQADLSHEVVAVDIEDSIRMNADCMASHLFNSSAFVSLLVTKIIGTGMTCFIFLHTS